MPTEVNDPTLATKKNKTTWMRWKNGPYTYNRSWVEFAVARELFEKAPRTRQQYQLQRRRQWPLPALRYSNRPILESKGRAFSYPVNLLQVLLYLETNIYMVYVHCTFIIVSFATQHKDHDNGNNNDQDCSHYRNY